MNSQPKIPVKQVDKQDVDLYQKRKKIYPRYTDGFFQRLRTITILVTVGAYLIVPWLTWGGRQAVLFDLPKRQFHVFGITFWPQDFVLLSWGLIIAAFSLFFFTALAGRLYCGYVCPQTVWTRIFIWLEHFTEGDRNARMKLDRTPTTAEKAAKKALKHTLWFAVAFLTSFTFVGYFTPIRELTLSIGHFSLNSWEMVWLTFFTAATYINAGWMREQVCMYMCPYARFQSAMLDKNSLIVTYDTERGEPRGARKKDANPKSLDLGDCVDCTMCVQVCPTGIDIRDGLQYECIGCAACIDACNEVMDKLGYDRGLVRYSNENTIEHHDSKILRPRIFFYAGLISVMGCLFLFTLFNRIPLELDIIKDRNQLYRFTNEGMVENVYTLKIMNMSQQPRHYKISAEGAEGMQLVGNLEPMIQSGEVRSLPVRIQMEEADLKSSNMTIYFTASDLDHPKVTVTEESRFIGPN